MDNCWLVIQLRIILQWHVDRRQVLSTMLVCHVLCCFRPINYARDDDDVCVVWLDVVLVIRRDRVDVYCNSVNYAHLMPMVAHWRRLRIHCLRSDNVTDSEEFKIASFVSMVDGCSVIGIPYSSVHTGY